MGFLAMILGPLMRMLYQMIPNFAVTMIVFHRDHQTAHASADDQTAEVHGQDVGVYTDDQ